MADGFLEYIRQSNSQTGENEMLTMKSTLSLVRIVCVLEFFGNDIAISNGHVLLPSVDETTARNERKALIRDYVIFGMPRNGLYSQTNCSGKDWQRFGRHAEAMYVLASHTGNTGHCVSVNRGSVLRDGTLTGGLRDLVDGKIDVYGEPGYPDHLLQNVVDYLYPHVNDNLCLLVRRAPIKRKNMMLSLSPIVGCVILFILLIVVTGLRISNIPSIEQAFLVVTRTFLSGLFDKQHRLLMVWISVLNFITSNVYAGCFTGLLVTPSKESEVDTLEEVYNKISVIYTYQKTVSMFHSIAKGNEMLDAFADRLKTSADWINVTVASNEAAILVSDFGVKWTLRLPGASVDGFSLLHAVKECVLAPAYFSFPVRKNWQHQKYFSALLQRFVEGGFMPKIIAKDLREMQKGKAQHIVPGMPPVPIEAISINHIREFLLTWLVGVLVSSVSFLLEFLFHKCPRKGQKGKDTYGMPYVGYRT